VETIRSKLLQQIRVKSALTQ